MVKVLLCAIIGQRDRMRLLWTQVVKATTKKSKNMCDVVQLNVPKKSSSLQSHSLNQSRKTAATGSGQRRLQGAVDFL